VKTLQRFRNRTHDFFRKIGWEVQRTSSLKKEKVKQYREAEVRKWDFASRYKPKTVLDIGANTGQFAELIRQVCPEVRIISFEPILECYEALKANQNITPPFEAINTALGNESGPTTIHRNHFSPSSSLLKMRDLHVEEMPVTRDSVTEAIRIQKLDELGPSLSIELPLLVKIDVQGFEEQVVLGGQTVLTEATAIVIEVSSCPLYDNAPSFDRIYELMKSMGFSYQGNVDQWKSQADGKILQFDALFERA
jgi:FkbM family methyltransferase